MTLFKSFVILFVFAFNLLSCNMDNILNANDEKKEKERENLLLLGLLALSQDQAITSYTGSMNYRHIGHTATLLNNGKVLIIGNGAELYDPDTGEFSIVGDNNSINRVYHSSILLQNGKVLVLGGIHNYSSGGDSIAENLLFDPDTNTFSNTGSFVTDRLYPSATLLNSGKVIVAGGNDTSSSHNTLASAELYNPNTETFFTTGSLNVSRYFQYSILLENGKVLIGPGGSSSSRYVHTLELYDPDTGTFSRSIDTDYSFVPLSLDSGKILFFNFGNEISDSCYELLLYDSNQETFSNTNQCSKIPAVSSKLNSGKVLFSGGTDSNNPQKRLELYNPDEGKNNYIGNMIEERVLHASTVLQNGKVLITGGNGSSSSTTAEIYSP